MKNKFHTVILVYARAHGRLCICVCVLFLCVFACVYVWYMYFICICFILCIYIYIFMCVCVCCIYFPYIWVIRLYIYIYIYTRICRKGWKGYMATSYLLTFWPMISKRCNTNRWNVWLHLVTFHEGIFVSLWTLQPTLVYRHDIHMHIYVYVM